MVGVSGTKWPSRPDQNGSKVTQPISDFRTLFLIGEVDAQLDHKNRLLIPAEFRKEIIDARNEKTLICQIGRKRVPWLYPENYFRELIAKRQMSLLPGDDEEAFNELNFGMIFRMAWDAQGRVVLPPKLVERTNLGKSLTIVGAGDHLVLRNREDWDRRAVTLLDSLDQIADREKARPVP